ncbi:MAG: hypothetical protein HPY44_12890 [Armatimonadetes bacterium]|nr:hypothetical protein [Armatimonadota bacterium]
MAARRVIKVRHLRPVPGAMRPAPRPMMRRPALLLAIGILLSGSVALVLLIHRVPNPPNMDLSRRLAFAFASLMGLFAAGMIGFALGMHGNRQGPVPPPKLGEELIDHQRRGRILIAIGIAMLLASGWLEYIAAFDKMP